MSVPRKIVKIGLQRLDGIAEIAFVKLPCDMGDHGRVTMLKTIALFDPVNGPRQAVFSYHNKDTGYCVYREVEIERR